MTDHSDRWSYDKITENIFLGADLCCGSDHYDFLHKELGISADIDMKKEDEPRPSRLLKEFLWLPVVDHEAPSLLQLETGVAMLEAIVRNGEKVYVHCRAGHGRGPTLVAAYFVKQGMRVDEALVKVKERRKVIHPTEVQVMRLEEYYRVVSGDK